MFEIILIALSYLLGSIPFGLIIGKFFGKDVRREGSKNIGATNVLRTVGILPGILTLFFDIGKGILPVYLAGIYFDDEIIKILTGSFAIIGHTNSIFLKFKGGKGVATAFGVILMLQFKISIYLVFIFSLVVLFTGYVSLASIISSLSLPLFFFYFKYPSYYIIFGIFFSCLVIYKHRENIKKLIEKKENKLYIKKR